MNDRVQGLWTAALRSDDYEQGKDYLQCDGLFCCLGVLCDLHAKETGISWDAPGLYDIPGPENGGVYSKYLEAYEFLPQEVIEWAGLTSSNPSVIYDGRQQSLSELNDDDKPFNLIADLIDQQL